MRLFTFPLLLFLALGPPAWGKIIAGEACQESYSRLGRIFSKPAAEAEPLPVDLKRLEAALDPDLRLRGRGGTLNAGLWRYSEDGREYFVKALGAGDHRQEIENAKILGDIGVGPKSYPFHDGRGLSYLLMEYAPGTNSKNLPWSMSELKLDSSELEGEIRKALGAAEKAPWEQVEKEYFAELYERRLEAAERLKEIREKLLGQGFTRLNDFQFMIHFERGVPGVEIQVIDGAFFQRTKASSAEDLFIEPIDNWIGALENWERQ